MSDDADDAQDVLRTALGAEPPPSVAALGEERTRLLAEALRTERAAQDEGLGEAAEAALKLVPALARGPVRKILFK